MKPALVILTVTVLAMGSPQAVIAQAQLRTAADRWGRRAPTAVQRAAVAIPDSIRKRVGYQHWKGGAIGGAVGGLAGLLLGLTVGRACDDCSSDDSDALEPALVGAGLGGAFGFLVGAASPKYRWVRQEDAE